jgi:hypothetical protein
MTKKLPLPASVRDLITARKKAKNERERLQPRLIENRDVFKSQMVKSLTGLAAGPQWRNFLRCGVEEAYSTCRNCGSFERYYYACNRKWCPLCNHKLAHARAERIRIWARTVHQPKHVVLTCQNFPILTRTRIRSFQRALVKLRRQDVWREVKGGCASIEITNSGQGWHLHAHILADARWIDASLLAKDWGRLVGQAFGIVKVKDVRGESYVQEVAKYVAKGSELACWPGEVLLEFIEAIRGVRFFAAFGSLRDLRRQIEAQIRFAKRDRKKCACGHCDWTYETEVSAVLHQIRREKGKPSRVARSMPALEPVCLKKIDRQLQLGEARRV